MCVYIKTEKTNIAVTAVDLLVCGSLGMDVQTAQKGKAQ